MKSADLRLCVPLGHSFCHLTFSFGYEDGLVNRQMFALSRAHAYGGSRRVSEYVPG